jgi:hypothetical protein
MNVSFKKTVVCSVPIYYLGGCIQTHKHAARMSQASSSGEAAARVKAMIDDEADAADKDSTTSDGPEQESEANLSDFVDDRPIEAESEAEPPDAVTFDTGNPVIGGQTRFDHDIEEVAARAEQREEEHNVRKALHEMDVSADDNAAAYVPMTPVAVKNKYSDVFPVSPCVCVCGRVLIDASQNSQPQVLPSQPSQVPPLPQPHRGVPQIAAAAAAASSPVLGPVSASKLVRCLLLLCCCITSVVLV